MTEVICRFCKEKINKDEAFKGTERNYFCNREHYLKQCDKIKYKPQVKKQDGEVNERRILTDTIQYIYEQYGIEKHLINWKLETARIKNILDENKDWRITGLIYTLDYMYNVLDVDFFNEQATCVMALVPFYYNEALNQYNRICDIENSIDNFEFNDEVNIVKPNNKRNFCKRININDI